MKRTLGGLFLFLVVSWYKTPAQAICHHSTPADGCHSTCFLWTEHLVDGEEVCSWTWGARGDACVVCTAANSCELTPCDEIGASAVNISKVDLEQSSFASCDPSDNPCASGEQCGVFNGEGACVEFQSE